jgi:ribosomal protein L7/L12
MTSVSIDTIALLALIVVFVLFLSGIQSRLARMERRAAEISRVEAKIDLLLKQANIEFDPYAHVAPEIVDALRAGEKIKAIKIYRQATGAGLRESKEFVEGVQRRSGLG